MWLEVRVAKVCHFQRLDAIGRDRFIDQHLMKQLKLAPFNVELNSNNPFSSKHGAGCRLKGGVAARSILQAANEGAPPGPARSPTLPLSAPLSSVLYPCIVNKWIRRVPNRVLASLPGHRHFARAQLRFDSRLPLRRVSQTLNSACDFGQQPATEALSLLDLHLAKL